MAIRAANILAGISAAGASGAELCWFGGVGAVTAPTDATTALVTTQTSEVQTVTVTGTPTGGTLTLSFGGVTTSGIAYNAAASAVQTALVALSTIGSGNVVVSGGPGPGTAWVVTFAGSLANQNVSAITANGAALTGGSTPAVSVAETTPGASGWLSAGLITEDGVSQDVKEASKDVRSYGVFTAVRKIVTSADITMKITMQETNKVTAAIYNRLPLGSIVPVAGAFTTTEGGFRSIRYGMVVHAVDGMSAVRKYYPTVEVTDRAGLTVKNGEIVDYGVTLTAYPDASGNAVYTYNLVDGLT